MVLVILVLLLVGQAAGECVRKAQIHSKEASFTSKVSVDLLVTRLESHIVPFLV